MRHAQAVSAFEEVAAGAAYLIPGGELVRKEGRYRDYKSDVPIVVRIGRFIVMAAAVVFTALFIFVVAAMVFFTLLLIVVAAVLFPVVMMTAVMLLALFFILMMAAVMLVLACNNFFERLITH
jgi:hypothetical protein